MKSTVLGMLSVAAVVAIQADAEVSLGRFGRSAIDVPQGGESVFAESLQVDGEATVDKTGAGTLVLPVQSVVGRRDLSMSVRGGTLKVVDTGTASPLGAAPEVFSKALMWLAADTNVVTDGSGNVTAWRDAREADMQTAASHPYAAPDKWSGPVVEACDGKQGLYFGGWNSGRQLYWMSAAGKKSYLNVRSVFVVHAVKNKWGFLLGDSGSTYNFYHVGGTAWQNGNPNSAMFGCQSRTTPYKCGRYYVDGLPVDAGIEMPKRGWQVLECHHNHFIPTTWQGQTYESIQYGLADSFFNHTDANGRQGGDWIGEVVVFDTQLTEAERLQVQAYLSRKWLGGEAMTAYSFATGAGTTVELDVGDGAPVTLAGEGTVEAAGTGVHTYRETADAPFGGALHVVPREGVAGYIGTGYMNLAVRGGETLNARMSEYGTELTASANGNAKLARKTGNGYIRVTELDPNVERFEIANGGVTYVPRGGQACVAGDGAQIEAQIDNGGFEATEASGYCNVYGTTAHGWTGSSTDGKSANVVLRRNAPDDFAWMCNYDAPEGTWALGINGNGVATTTVSVPVAGEYDFSMWTCQRQQWGGGLLEVVLVRDAVEYPVASFEPHYAASWSHYEDQLGASDGDHRSGYLFSRYRTPFLAAGTYSLVIRARKIGGLTAMVDGLKMTLSSGLTPGNVVKVPNGDFERLDAASYTYTKIPYLCINNQLEGWTLHQNGKAPGTTDNNKEGDVNVSMPSTLRGWNPSLHAYGAHCLVFFENGGSAESAAFAVPAGTYRLRHKMASYPYDASPISGTKLNGSQTFAASVEVGGVKTELGEVSAPSSIHRWKTVEYGTAFTVGEGQTVKLTVAATGATAAGFIDDIELVNTATAAKRPPEHSKLLTVVVNEGATLTLDYAGESRVSKVIIGNEVIRSGVVSAATHPGVIYGTGALRVGGGFSLFVR